MRVFDESNLSFSGSVDKDKIEVTNCFCVPHKEYEERVEADLKFAEDMFDLNKKVAPQESVIGWFATGNVDCDEWRILIKSDSASILFHISLRWRPSKTCETLMQILHFFHFSITADCHVQS